MKLLELWFFQGSAMDLQLISPVIKSILMPSRERLYIGNFLCKNNKRVSGIA